jgi:transcription elongation factor Elf1
MIEYGQFRCHFFGTKHLGDFFVDQCLGTHYARCGSCEQNNENPDLCTVRRVIDNLSNAARSYAEVSQSIRSFHRRSDADS